MVGTSTRISGIVGIALLLVAGALPTGVAVGADGQVETGAEATGQGTSLFAVGCELGELRPGEHGPRYGASCDTGATGTACLTVVWGADLGQAGFGGSSTCEAGVWVGQEARDLLHEAWAELPAEGPPEAHCAVWVGTGSLAYDCGAGPSEEPSQRP